MAKKFSLLLAAVAVLAFAIPSMASASKATDPVNTLVPVGSEVTGTGTDIILQSNLLGTITCATLNLNGKITKNDGTTVEASGANVSPTQAGCKNGTKTVTVTSVELTKLFSEVSNTGYVNFVAKVDVAELACTFTGLEVPFTYTTGTNVLKFASGAGVTSSPASCGTAKLTGEFALETKGTTTQIVLD
jgi:hypothetical protein